MCGGGFFRDSIILVSGPTGTGKTLVTTEFLAGGVRERASAACCSPSRRAASSSSATRMGWGVDFAEMEAAGPAAGSSASIPRRPPRGPPDPHEEESSTSSARPRGDRQPLGPRAGRLLKSFREFVIGLTSFIKHRESPGSSPSTTSTILGGTSVTETHISTITDSIILLRYVEMLGEMRRGLAVLKMRGSTHDKDIREFTIDGRACTSASRSAPSSASCRASFTHVEHRGRLRPGPMEGSRPRERPGSRHDRGARRPAGCGRPRDRRRRWRRCRLALRASEARFRNVIEANADGVIVVVRDAAIAFANPAATALLGRKAEELSAASSASRSWRARRPRSTSRSAGGPSSSCAELRVVRDRWEGRPALLASLRDVTDRKAPGGRACADRPSNSPRPIVARTSSWRCSPTSRRGTRWHRSSTRPT